MTFMRPETEPTLSAGVSKADRPARLQATVSESGVTGFLRGIRALFAPPARLQARHEPTAGRNRGEANDAGDESGRREPYLTR